MFCWIIIPTWKSTRNRTVVSARTVNAGGIPRRASINTTGRSIEAIRSAMTIG